MKVASIAEVTAKFNDYLEDTQEGPVVVTQNGKPVAMLLAVQDEEDVERLVLASSPKLREILERGRKQIQSGQTVTHADLWEELEADPERTE